MPHWPSMQALMIRSLCSYGSQQCIVWEGGSATYTETSQRIASIASFIQSRTKPDGRVGILLPNCREFLELIIAIVVAGRVRVSFNVQESPGSIAHKLALSSTTLLFTDTTRRELLDSEVTGFAGEIVIVGDGGVGPTYQELLRSSGDLGCLERVSDDRYGRLGFTGGTTGTPKAVLRTFRQELALTRNLLMEAYTPDERAPFVAATPLSHASATFVLPTIFGGGSLSWLPRFDAERLADASWLGAGRGTQSFLVPTALDDLVRTVDGRIHDVVHLVYGGAPCPPSVLERARSAIGARRLLQIYGQVEAPMTISRLSGPEHEDSSVFGSAGRPFLYVDVGIERYGEPISEAGAVGEIVVRSDHVMDGYLDAPEETAARFTHDGRLRTNDLGFLDDRGLLWIVGRQGDMLISGGYNIFPDEVERRLGAVEGVRELVAFGVPHPRWGEATVIAIVAEPGSANPESAVSAAARERLAAYERPKKVLVLDKLPLTAIGKVARGRLTTDFHDLFS